MELPMQRPLRALKRVRLADRAAEAIKDYILANDLTAGDRLPSESELASALSVSRHMIRQAASSLEAVGIIRVVHGSGMYVGEVANTGLFRMLASWINARDLDDQQFIEVRSCFERFVYELVIDRATNEDLDRLEAIALALRDTASDEEAGRLHDEFHRALLAATGNRFLMALGTILTRFFWTLAYSAPHVHRVSLDETRQRHAMLVAMLRRRIKVDIPEIVTLHLMVTDPLRSEDKEKIV